MRFEIFGPIQVHGAHGRVAVTGHQRVLLGMLLLHANEVVTVERLIEAIWADRPARDARNQVHGCVYRLRRRLANAGLPEQIVTDEAGYELRVDADSVDLSRFRRLVTDARSAAKQDRLHDAVDGYLAALRLWRGPAMAGVDSPLVRNAAAILDEEHVQAAEECIGIELELGRAGELVAKLTDLVSRYPYRETLHGTLMLALYRAGRPADALAAQRTIGNRDGEYTVDNDLGALYRALRDFDHAIPRHRQALAIAQDAGDKAGECMVRNDLGRTLREGGEVSAALAEHRAVLTEATKIKLKLEQARALDGIAACLRETEPQEARRHWQRALVLYREMGVPERAEVEHQLAGLTSEAGSTTDSEPPDATSSSR